MSENAAGSSTYHSFRRILLSSCLVVTCLAILFLGESLISPKLSHHLRLPPFRTFNSPERAFTPANAHLHLVLPATGPNPNLCKAIASSLILKYPPPILIGWNSPHDSSHLSKIGAVNAFLHTLDATNDKDLLLIVDSLDTWFQLPVSVLLSRYHASNARANSRFASGGYNQTIILASEKKCWPASVDSLTCSQVPDPPISKTIFGTQTDQVRGLDSSNPYQFMRPRYLNSGFLLGPVRDVRNLYQRAEEKVRKEGRRLMTDQGVLGRVWAEQEVMRGEHRAQRMATSPEVKGKFGRYEKREFKEPWYPEKNKSYEFGMGIDYEGSLSMTKQWAWTDAEWVTLGNVSDIQAAIDAFRITDPRIRPSEIPSDLSKSGPPFQLLGGEMERTKWQDLKLYTNLWTGVVPVTIHHNAKPDHERKVLRDEKWGSMWFAGYVRQMFEARQKEIDVDEERKAATAGMGREWYNNQSVGEGKSRTDDFRVRTLSREGEAGWVSWSELCDEVVSTEVLGP